ncbi:hypothetical protein [Nonomuraea sp. WAC 01424]|uniref:hypothetical protein n=1 Tax=Nonomuraea sp. WAC 01424 TaxID=2203200 RepID=UPI00163C7CB4|nr:hypothetical protein [Nonomuraea sp. WAC 01424]
MSALLTNFATAGPPPEPFASSPWLTYVALAAVTVISATLAVRMLASGEGPSAQDGGPPASKARSRALGDVRREASERLEIGLPPLRLRFREAPELVLAPVEDAGHRTLRPRPDAEIVSVFDDLRGSMLLVGAPGAGKTTELHRLALALAERAEAEPEDREPVPIVLSLASRSGLRGDVSPRRRLTGVPWLRRWSGWSKVWPFRRRERDTRQRPAGPPALTVEDLKEWIARAARARYKIPAGVTKRWLADGALVRVVDGLDEIPPGEREVMVRLVNELHAGDAAPPVVLTCRSGEYESLDARLRLEGAVRIEALTIEEVRAYADAGDERFEALRALLRQDSDLDALVTTPLWLQIAADASTGGSGSGLPRRVLPGELLALYEQTMITSRPSPRMPPARARRSLRRLAAVDGEDDLRTVYRWIDPSPEARTLALLHGLPWAGAAWAAAGLALPLASRLGFTVAGLAYLVAIFVLVGAAREVFARLPFVTGSPSTGTRHLIAVHAVGAALGVTSGGLLWLGTWALTELARPLPGPVHWLLLLSALVAASGWETVTAPTPAGRAVTGVILAGLLTACFLLPALPVFYVEIYAALLVAFLAAVVLAGAVVLLVPSAASGAEGNDGPARAVDAFPEVVTSRSILQNAVSKRIVVLAAAAAAAVVLVTDEGDFDGETGLWSIAVLALAVFWLVPIAMIEPGSPVRAVHHLIMRVALPLGGWLPWRLMPVLRFGAERDLLVGALGQYRFRHPLIKEHFAGALDRRDAEDAAGYPASHALLAARVRDLLAEEDRLGMVVMSQAADGRPGEPIPVTDLPGRLQAETLLVGPPDSGGRIVLAELAAALLDPADATPSEALAMPGGLPVLVDVRSWRPPPEWRRGESADHPLVAWLATRVAAGHRIPRDMAARWLRAGRPTLLIDGLGTLAERRVKPLLALLAELCERYGLRYAALSPTAVKGPQAFTILPLPGPVRAAYLTPELLRIAAGDTGVWDLLIRPGRLLPIARGAGRHPARYGFLAGLVAHGLARRPDDDPVRTLRSLSLAARATFLSTALSPVSADLVRRLCLPVVYVAAMITGLGLPLAHRYGWPAAAAWTPLAMLAAWLTAASLLRPRSRCAIATAGRRRRIVYGLCGVPPGVALGLMVAPLAHVLGLAIPALTRYVTGQPDVLTPVLNVFRTAFEALGWTDTEISTWTGPDLRVLVMLLFWVMVQNFADLFHGRLDFGARLVVQLLVLGAVFLLFDGMSPARLTGTFCLGAAFGASMVVPVLWLRLAEGEETGSPDRPRVNRSVLAALLVIPLLAGAVERGLLPGVLGDLRLLLLGVPVGGAVALLLTTPIFLVWDMVVRALPGVPRFRSDRFLAGLRAEGLDLNHPLVHAFVRRIDPDEGLPPPDGHDAAVRAELIASVRAGLPEVPADPGLIRRFDAAAGTLILSGTHAPSDTRHDRRQALYVLAAELLRRAEAEPTAPVPVVLPAPRAFPRTGPARRRVTSWVAGELAREHGVDVETAIRWLGEKRLALLIDLGPWTPIRLRRHLRLVTECVTALDLPYALTAEPARRRRRDRRTWRGGTCHAGSARPPGGGGAVTCREPS